MFYGKDGSIIQLKMSHPALTNAGLCCYKEMSLMANIPEEFFPHSYITSFNKLCSLLFQRDFCSERLNITLSS